MLDTLMGTARDGESSRYNVKFTDSKVCKSFLLSCCPHEILASTVSAPILSTDSKEKERRIRLFFKAKQRTRTS